MASDAAPTHNSAVIEKLLKQHGDLLNDNESIIAALRGGAVDRVQPGRVFGMFGAVGRVMQRSLSEDKISDRAGQVNLFLHRKGLTLHPLVKTKVGYTLAITQRRVLMFNFSGRRFLSESAIAGMRIEMLKHGADMRTLFFCEGGQAAAVTSWDDAEATDSFVAVYRRIQQYLLTRAG